MNNTNDFFPSDDYKMPVVSNYMKISSPGDYTFRVLSSAVVGWEYFNDQNKPTRSKEQFDGVPEDIKEGGRISHFWAFFVWNYDAKRVQVLELNQKTIMGPMQALIRNPKWGNPKGYDITITRKGTGMSDTEYAVMPNPHTPVSQDISSEFGDMKLDLELIFTGGDPFAPEK